MRTTTQNAKRKTQNYLRMFFIKAFLSFMFYVLSFTFPLHAAPRQAGDFGVGVILGSPLGLSTKWWTSRETAVAMALGASHSDIELTGDFLWHTEQLFPKPAQGNLPLFLGLGGRVRFEDDPEVGIRFVGGLEYLVANVPLGVFVELVPILDIAPDVEADFSGGIGVRYYFVNPLRKR